MRNVIYMAHPVAPTEDELAAIPMEIVEAGRGEYEHDLRALVPHAARVALAVQANIDRALRWLRWLRRSFPETTFIAPWIAAIQSGKGEDADPALREAGLVDCCAVVERCDGIVLVGGRISSGMWREVGCENGAFGVHDLTALGVEPPTFQIWIEQGCKIWKLANKR